MDARVLAAQRAAADLLPEAERWLEDWLRIPSVSGGPAHRADVAAAARFVAARLARFASVRLVVGRGGPVVVARVPGRDRRPAVLVYGHLDVKPGGPGWHSDPFEPLRRGRTLVARGASDDKGQVLAHLVALEAWTRVGGPPGDVVVVLESAEEIGSPGLGEVLEQVRAQLRVPAGAVLVSDTRRARPGAPSLTVTQRGMLGLRVSVDAGGPPVHAGRYGGAVRDPTLVLAAALLRAERMLARLPADPQVPRGSDESIRRSAGRAVHRDRLAERSAARAAISVTSVRAGGPPGAVPRSASARVDVRLPPSVAPAAVLPALRDVLTRADRAPLRVEVVVESSCRGFVAHHTASTLAAVRRACVAGFGRPCDVVGSGGSIPAVIALQETFGHSPVLLGLGSVNDGAHGPDEHLDLDALAQGTHASVALLPLLSLESHPSVSGPERVNPARPGTVGPSGHIAWTDAEKRSGPPQRLERRHG